MFEIQRRPHCNQGHASGVLFGLQWQAGDDSANGIDANQRLVDASHRGVVAGAGKTVSKYVETDRDIAYAGWREGAADVSTHKRAPIAAPTRSRSANTPAAVTSGPAPGPCTMSGLSW